MTLSIMTFNAYEECYTECRNEVHYAECHYAECRCAECHYGEGHGSLPPCCSGTTRSSCHQIPQGGSLYHVMNKKYS